MVALERPAVRYPLARVTYGVEEIEAVVETLESGRTTMGPRVATFEERFAAFVGARHAVMVNSGSSADLLAVYALAGLDEPSRTKGRTEILVPAVTWPTQVWSCVQAGYTVRLVDVDSATLQFDADDLAAKASPHTAALFPVHLLGNVGQMDRLRQTAIGCQAPILEDCCEALGARWRGEHVGTHCLAAAFSFFFSHLLTTMEGGMVATAFEYAVPAFRLWRSHGWQPKDGEPFHFPSWGMNLRPTELQGAFGLVQMDKLPAFMEARRANFARLHAAVHGYGPGIFRPIVVHEQAEPSWHAYPFLLSPNAPFTKRQLCASFEERGIETRPIVAGNLARQPAVAHHPKVISGPLPGADAVHERGFYIGLANHDDPDGTGYVCQVLADFMREGGW